MEKIVLDTNILIEVLKNNQKIINKLDSLNAVFCISSITVMELYYGAFNKAELLKLKKFISLFQIIDLSKSISTKSEDLIYKYAKSHNLTIPDSLIASTCIAHTLKLYTLNLKDFRFLTEIELLS